jgi:hypothetical protein
MSDRSQVITELRPQPISEVVKDIMHDISRILRAEIRLARTELAEKAKTGARAGAMLGAAAVTGLLAGVCFVATCIAALALVMPLWLACLIMAILLSFTAAGAFAMGRGRLRSVDPVPQQTLKTIKDDVEWAKKRTAS